MDEGREQKHIAAEKGLKGLQDAVSLLENLCEKIEQGETPQMAEGKNEKTRPLPLSEFLNILPAELEAYVVRILKVEGRIRSLLF
jgi:hypothetical protein